MLLWTSAAALHTFKHLISWKMCPKHINCPRSSEEVIRHTREQTMDLLPAFLYPVPRQMSFPLKSLLLPPRVTDCWQPSLPSNASQPINPQFNNKRGAEISPGMEFSPGTEKSYSLHQMQYNFAAHFRWQAEILNIWQESSQQGNLSTSVCNVPATCNNVCHYYFQQ